MLKVLDTKTCMERVEIELSPKKLFETQICAGGEPNEVSE